MSQDHDIAPGQRTVSAPPPRRPDFWRRPLTGPFAGLRVRLTEIGDKMVELAVSLDRQVRSGLAGAQNRLADLRQARVRTTPSVPAPAPLPEPEAPPPALNPLVRTATPLLALMSRLPTLPPPTNTEGLRHRIIAALRRFQSAARAAGVGADQMRAAHFTLCAAFDDIITHTEWGRQANWAERSLIQTFHKSIEPDRGVITLLDHMLTEPRSHICELELISVCMALGFEGRYRVMGDGPPAFRHVRDQIYRAIASVRGEPAAELSPEWRPAPPPRRPLAVAVPPWVAISLAGAALAGFYVLLTLSIGGHADRVYQKLAALLPDRPAVIAHYEPATTAASPPLPAETTAPAPPQLSARAKRYQTALGPEIAAGMIEVATERDIDILRISGVNAFVRGGEILTRAGHQLVERLAMLLDREPGRLLVVGHTDDQPSLSIRLPSALSLSEARARAIARVLVAHLNSPERIDIEGRADTEPLVANTSAVNRDRNRRVEIVLPHGEARR